MRRSEAEIHRVLSLFPDRKVPVFAGSERWLTEAGGPVPSPAADDLIERSHAGSSPLYVVAIGDLFGRLAGRAGTAGAGLTVDEAEAHNEVGR